MRVSIPQHQSHPKSSLHSRRSTHYDAISSQTAPAADNFIHIRKAQNSPEYRAAAYLRAQSFYTYPEDRSEFARRAHFRMKADDMWQQIEQGVATTWTDPIVSPPSEPLMIPLIATATHLDDVPVASYMQEASVSLPKQPENGTLPDYVIGTLDVNIGLKLPAEELIGRLPPGTQSIPQYGRAYLSNVCVLPAARRRGIASRLIEAACCIARDEYNVEHMYVHVVAENGPARRLYEQICKFSVEQEEDEKVARSLNRPRRLLLHRALMIQE